MTKHRDLVALVTAAFSTSVFGTEASSADEPVPLIINIDVLPDRAAEGEAVLREEGRLSR